VDSGRTAGDLKKSKRHTPGIDSSGTILAFSVTERTICLVARRMDVTQLREHECVLTFAKSEMAHRNALTAVSPFELLATASSVGAAQLERFSATNSVPMTPRKPHSNLGQKAQCKARWRRF
jgi:hypothetical protein